MKNKTNSNRTFGILFAIVFFIIALWPLTNNEGVRLWSVIVALIFLFIGLFKPNILDPLNTIWIKLGELLLSKYKAWDVIEQFHLKLVDVSKILTDLKSMVPNP